MPTAINMALNGGGPRMSDIIEKVIKQRANTVPSAIRIETHQDEQKQLP